MQKKMNDKTVGAVYTSYLYKISVQTEGRKLENKKVIKIIKIDEAKTYEIVVVF